MGGGVEESNEYESIVSFVPKNRYSEVLDGQNELIFCTQGTFKKNYEFFLLNRIQKNNIKIIKKMENNVL